MGYRKNLLFGLSIFLYGMSFGVDHSKFSKCNNDSFCSLLRNTPKSDTFKIDAFDELGEFVISDGKEQYLAKLEMLQEGIIKFKIQVDLAVDVVMQDFMPKQSSLSCFRLIQPIEENRLGYQSGKSLVRVQKEPILIEVIDLDSEILHISIDELWIKKNFDFSEKDDEEQELEKDQTIEPVHIKANFPDSKSFYGIPEHADSFSLKPLINRDPYRLYNLDVFEYELNSTMSLYGSIPYLISLSSKGLVGLFWNNPSETWIDIKTKEEIKVVSEFGNVEIYILLDKTFAGLQEKYINLTGPPQLPPLFALGYHQSRWNYNDEREVLEIDERFDKEGIPYDVIWLDIEHTDGKRYMTWNSDTFPDPKGLLESLDKKGRKLVTIVDPHIKVDENYQLYKTLAQKGFTVKNKRGGVFEGDCWPGKSVWVDFVNPEAADWWTSLYNDYAEAKNHFIWNDMNEPSVFEGKEITFPKENLHTIQSTGHSTIMHAKIHNLYGALMQRATFKGLEVKKTRPFVLSRSFYAGSQRFGSVWTGDNKASWDHLAVSVPMILSLGVAGLPFAGADVGGFFGDPDPELMVRWYQTGSLQPFFRGHAHIETKKREPWLFPEPHFTAMKEALKLRYKILPYLYTLFYEAHTKGIPVMRSMIQEFPNHEQYLDVDNQYLLGSSLLHRPITEPNPKNIDTFLPEDDNLWYDFFKGRVIKQKKFTFTPKLNETILLVRGGSIIPMKMRPRRNSFTMKNDPYTLLLAPDSKDQAIGRLYYDDGESFDYQSGNFSHFEFKFSGNQFSITPLHQGYKRGNNSIEKIIIYLKENKVVIFETAINLNEVVKPLEFQLFSVQ
jgi:mannosyl-oligosaccharide alpha-1,3-glucosidase